MIPRAMLAAAYVTGVPSPARQVKGDVPDKKGYPGPTVWGLGVRLIVRKPKKGGGRPRPTQGCTADDYDF